MSHKNPLFLDATHLSCPMPSVHLRIKLDQLEPDQHLEMHGRGETALENAKTLLSMLHYPAPELLSKDDRAGTWHLLISPKKPT